MKFISFAVDAFSLLAQHKGSYPVWEDFINKAGKLQSQLRTTVVAAAAFLDAFQKVADMATNTRDLPNGNTGEYINVCLSGVTLAHPKVKDMPGNWVHCLLRVTAIGIAIIVF
ncbi:hypothetical protein TURU_067962 [Turdus rufiventris]|nr:hypothetical protein TURU_067962 [Turdus rufiventris]